MGLLLVLGLVVLVAGLAYAQWQNRGGEPFGVAGQVLLVNGQPVQVYVFASTADREKVVFSDDGTSVTVDGRPAMFTWIAPPRIVEAKNVLITVVLPDVELADGIVGALQGLGGGN